MAKTKTKSDRIITLLDHGKSVAEIVKITKYSPSTVYGVRCAWKASSQPEGGVRDHHNHPQESVASNRYCGATSAKS